MLLTPSQEIQVRFKAQRTEFACESYPSLQARLCRLDRLLSITEAHDAEIVQAIDADFCGRSAQETPLAGRSIVRDGIRNAQSQLTHWTRNRHMTTEIQFSRGHNRIAAQPLGVVGVVAPWNYSLQLTVDPGVAAPAAGNRIMIKPWE